MMANTLTDIQELNGDFKITENNELTTNQTNTEKRETSKSARPTWNRQVEFLLTLIGYNVGYGNLWRFPYLCTRNGGGAFLIPYFFFLVICGIPLFYLEAAVSQFSSRSPICVWTVTPLFKGLGWGMVAISAMISIYYNVILAWTLFYLVRSFTTVLPWSNCNNAWNTPGCTDLSSVARNNCDTSWNISDCGDLANLTTDRIFNTTGIPMISGSNMEANMTPSDIFSTTVDTHESEKFKRLTPAEEFWQFEVLQLSDGIDQPGVIRWQLLLCLMAAWIVVFLCLIKGIRSSGKVVYVTATAPYLFLTILLIRGVFLPGALDGIKYFIIPDFQQLANFKVWGEACLQIFYTLGPCFGGIMTMASYNRFHHNCLRDTIISAFTCSGTSFYAGFVIFSIIGFMANEAGVKVTEVVTSGPGLVFIVYPDALTRLPIAPMWSFFFFFMLLLLGLDSQFATVETVVTGIVDNFPKYLKNRKMIFTAILCFVEFLLGIPMVTQGGMYLFQIVDWYSAAFSLIIIGFLEGLVLSHVYGLSRLDNDIRMMLGHGVNMFWKICWAFVTPVCLFGIIIFTIFLWQPPVYGDYHYPEWAITLGWMMAMYSIVPIPVLAIFEITKAKGSFLQRIKKLLHPADDWGPALQEDRIGFKYNTPGHQHQSQEVPLRSI